MKQRIEIAFALMADIARKCEPCVWRLCESQLASVLRRGNGEWELVSGIDADERANAQQRDAILQLRAVQREDPWQRSPGWLVSFCDVCIRRIYRQDYELLNGHCPTTLFKAQYTSKRSK